MIKQIEIKVLPDKVDDVSYIHALIHRQLKSHSDEIKHIQLIRKSIDARSKKPVYLLRYDVYIDEIFVAPTTVCSLFNDVSANPRVLIIGAGPAGYFAALECLGQGLQPIILERGKDVKERRRDLKAIQQDGIVHPDSNYCFGEGGAGTYSDGKLYTRSIKRGKLEKVLQLLVEHGAPNDILSDAHPHIGSNKLPQIIANIRDTIIRFGGQVIFNHRVTDFIIEDNQMIGVRCGEEAFMGAATILATGHSARDIYRLLYTKNIKIEAKPFALGLRIEHQQNFIDQTQYHQPDRDPNLPASSYSVVTQVDQKGVFSFCMCPGGLVVPAATSPGEIVVNGMSLSRRDSPFANSGFVTSIDLEELESHGYTGVFASLDFQTDVEQAMYRASDGSQKAPAQRVEDFVNGQLSPILNDTSYIPGLISSPLHSILPSFVYHRLRVGLIEINKKMLGYLTNEANIIGVESRTSAPIRIPRLPETLMHPEISGLFPCGEGAGYAGGIISAAMDGQNVVKAIRSFVQTTTTEH
ncbi:MAG: FAD-binding protein [Saprospiraceae bacterium]